MNELIEMIIIYAEHIYDEAHLELTFEKAMKDDNYFDNLIYYGERYLEYVKASQALARACKLIKEDE